MATVARVLSRRLPAAQSDVETLKDSGHVFWSRPGRVAVSGGERAGYQRRILVTAKIIVQGSVRDPVKLFRSFTATKRCWVPTKPFSLPREDTPKPAPDSNAVDQPTRV